MKSIKTSDLKMNLSNKSKKVNSMDLYRHICRFIVVPLWAEYERSPYLKHYKYLQKSQYFDDSIVRQKQWDAIKRLLKHVYKNTAFYRDSFDRMGIKPEDIKSFDDFQKIPYLTKNDVRNHKGSLFANNYDKYIRFYTSGSTGIPIEGYRNMECHEFKRACGVRSSTWSGYNIGERVYCVYGDPEKKKTLKSKIRRKFLNRERFLNSLELTDASMMQFAQQMIKKPPAMVWGHAHNIYILAKFLEKNGITDIQPKGMFSAGMVLYEWQREKIEKVFKCEFQDRYGCEEIGLIAAECKKKEGLHINTDDLFVEFVDKAGQYVEPGMPGQLIVTDLHNYVMPFIRYRMDDIGVYSDKKCTCGRNQPLIKKIEGRIADFLVSPDGKTISGISLTDHFGASIPGVAQIQIIQEKIDFIRLKIVKDSDFNDKSLDQMKKLVKEFFGKQMKFECEFVDKIPQEPSGKYRFTICNIDNPYL